MSASIGRNLPAMVNRRLPRSTSFSRSSRIDLVSLNLAGVLYIEVPDSSTLVQDAWSIIDGLRGAMTNGPSMKNDGSTGS
ncbi:hypothetical protein AB0I81_60055 [Nonomuraea sp. NPDC050404]|uniref:hypothetical protein n=1 Tax=Nonomuraea sp. NPDC050404 TaxID=3155783 RepID=UPI0033EFF7AB